MSVELAQLEALTERLKDTAETMGEAVDIAANRMTSAALESVIKNSPPPRTGQLNSGWGGNVNIEKTGSTRTVTITNNVKYAEYVENGHIQHPGQFVPGLGKDGRGRRLVKSFVEGAHMAKRAEIHCKRVANQICKMSVEEALRKKVGE